MEENLAEEWIVIQGARVHNLKNIDVRIPRNSLTVITGLSGSGKSSLAFDTLYAEGQRRYIETFSAYARNFLGGLQRPDVDKIEGLSPVISIEQKTTNKNPRSTVGTTTEVYDFLRLLFARTADAYSYVTGEKMVKYTEEQIVSCILEKYKQHRILLLAPKIRNRKGHYKELFETLRRKGYLHVRIDGELQELTEGMRLDRYKNHDIELVVDRLAVRAEDQVRLEKSVAHTLKQGDGVLMVVDADDHSVAFFSRDLMCPTSGIAYHEPAPHDFSFNSPQGACPHCKGLGFVHQVDQQKVFPNPSLSIRKGGIAPLGKYQSTMIFWQIQVLLEHNGYTLDTPVGELDQDILNDLLHGTSERMLIPTTISKATQTYYTNFQGITQYIHQLLDEELNPAAQKWVDSFSRVTECPECHGTRLNQQALHFRLLDQNIASLSRMDLSELYEWMQNLLPQLPTRKQVIAEEIVKEITTRLRFLLDVGLEYLSLARPTMSLSGGESQRIRLATQIGSQLVNVLYILDEPSIGLHQRDNHRLIESLKALRDIGNTVIVVEHDQEMMEQADYIVDIGPMAGKRGGEVVFQGTYQEMLQQQTLTSQYLNGMREIAIPTQRRTGNGLQLQLYGAKGNNLKNVDISFPLGCLVCVTGVSGSGKSTLVNDTLHPILSQHFYRSLQEPLPYDRIEGMEHIDKVVNVDQSPLGRTPRSCPATYTGVFNDIRQLFAELPEAKIRGYKAGRFSFNVKGGRCEVCGGNGYKRVEMNFLPDVYVPCEACRGKRYERETLEVRYRGKSIADVLDMTIRQAVEFFEHQPTILHKIQVLQEVGLGYIRLGQACTTLSGGESQRVKLATELSKRDTGRTLYILDEPTTGLHFEDIRALLEVLQQLVERGNTVVIIEHNLDVIKCADWLIELGPEGGKQGGKVLFQGIPEDIVHCTQSPTAPFLQGYFR